MKSSSSSSGKSEARSPFVKSSGPQTPVEGRLKRKLDFDVDLILTAPVMNTGCSNPAKRNTSFHLRDESITQPLDWSRKKIDLVDLVGNSDDQRESGAASHNPPKICFPTHGLPPAPLISRPLHADIPGPSSRNPATDVNMTMQVRIEQLKAEVARLRQIIMAIPCSAGVNSPALKSPAPAESPESDAFGVWFSSPDASNTLMRVPVPTLDAEGVTRDWFRPILDKCELITEHVSLNLWYSTMRQF